MESVDLSDYLIEILAGFAICELKLLIFDSPIASLLTCCAISKMQLNSLESSSDLQLPMLRCLFRHWYQCLDIYLSIGLMILYMLARAALVQMAKSLMSAYGLL